MFEAYSFNSILADLLSNVPSDVDTREGSVIYDALAPVAIELSQMYINLDVVLAETFGDTASRDFLVRRAFERGVSPYSATFAVWKGDFNMPVSIGARFSLDELNFVVTSAISDTSFMLQCETVGTVGNKSYGSLIPIDYISGLTSAVLSELLVPAQDDEDTEVFRERYLNSFDSQAFGGNVADYLAKTNSIDGVGATKVTPVWNGGGTVKLTILDAEFNQATSTLVSIVQETIDPVQDGSGVGLAPIGHIVTVDTPDIISVSICAKITFDTGFSFDNLKLSIFNAVDEYFLELRRDWADYSNLVVRIAQIETKIISINGIIDISDTCINGVCENLVLGNFQIASLIEVDNYG